MQQLHRQNGSTRCLRLLNGFLFACSFDRYLTLCFRIIWCTRCYPGPITRLSSTSTEELHFLRCERFSLAGASGHNSSLRMISGKLSGIAKRRSNCAPPLLLRSATRFGSHQLAMFATAMGPATVRSTTTRSAAMGCATMCCSHMRSAMGSVAACSCRMGTTCEGSGVGPSVAGTHYRSAACTSTIGRETASAVISSTTTAAETMTSPAVAIAPASPWAHAQEDTVVEIARPVKTNWCAGIWCVVIVTVGTSRLNADDNLRVNLWRHSQDREQCCS
jgi:hypothetical protein